MVIIYSYNIKSVTGETHNAGECFPLLTPLGCRWQKPAVKVRKSLFERPQYLQVYTSFSLPSYNLCLPMPGPDGCWWQYPAVKLCTDEALRPQYSQ